VAKEKVSHLTVYFTLETPILSSSLCSLLEPAQCLWGIMQLTIGTSGIVVGSGKEGSVAAVLIIVNKGKDVIGIGLQQVGLVGCLGGKQVVVHAVGLGCRLDGVFVLGEQA
jgi:hypothetical protein